MSIGEMFAAVYPALGGLAIVAFVASLLAAALAKGKHDDDEDW